MVDNRLKEFFDNILGDSGIIMSNQSDVNYYCPFCKHKKRKFQINLDRSSPEFQFYSCWVCKQSNHSSGKSLVFLLKKLGYTKHLQQLNSLLNQTVLSRTPIKTDNHKHTNNSEILQLPQEFISLLENKKENNPEYKNALNYISKRGITYSDILKYNIGYCEQGEYSGKIIIPSYDENGNLNYFVGRSYYDVKFGKHKNPKWTKNFIGFELFINWKEPIILVEGSFDAITVKRNVIPLFGKDVSQKLLTKILQEKIQKLYIALDPDAIREIIPIAEKFIGLGVDVHIVDLRDKDPNEHGYEAITELIKITQKTTFKDLIKLKMKLKGLK